MKKVKILTVSILASLMTITSFGRPNRPGPGPMHRPPMHWNPPHRHHNNWWIPAAIVGGAIIISGISNSSQPTVIVDNSNKKVVRIDVLPDGTKIYYYGE